MVRYCFAIFQSFPIGLYKAWVIHQISAPPTLLPRSLFFSFSTIVPSWRAPNTYSYLLNENVSKKDFIHVCVLYVLLYHQIIYFLYRKYLVCSRGSHQSSNGRRWLFPFFFCPNPRAAHSQVIFHITYSSRWVAVVVLLLLPNTEHIANAKPEPQKNNIMDKFHKI